LMRVDFLWREGEILAALVAKQKLKS